MYGKCEKSVYIRHKTIDSMAEMYWFMVIVLNMAQILCLMVKSVIDLSNGNLKDVSIFFGSEQTL